MNLQAILKELSAEELKAQTFKLALKAAHKMAEARPKARARNPDGSFCDPGALEAEAAEAAERRNELKQARSKVCLRLADGSLREPGVSEAEAAWLAGLTKPQNWHRMEFETKSVRKDGYPEKRDANVSVKLPLWRWLLFRLRADQHEDLVLLDRVTGMPPVLPIKLYKQGVKPDSAPFPSPAEVQRVRKNANLTLEEARLLAGYSAYPQWSTNESPSATDPEVAVKPMEPSRWFLFQILVGIHPDFVVVPKGVFKGVSNDSHHPISQHVQSSARSRADQPMLDPSRPDDGGISDNSDLPTDVSQPLLSESENEFNEARSAALERAKIIIERYQLNPFDVGFKEALSDFYRDKMTGLRFSGRGTHLHKNEWVKAGATLAEDLAAFQKDVIEFGITKQKQKNKKGEDKIDYSAFITFQIEHPDKINKRKRFTRWVYFLAEQTPEPETVVAARAEGLLQRRRVTKSVTAKDANGSVYSVEPDWCAKARAAGTLERFVASKNEWVPAEATRALDEAARQADLAKLKAAKQSSEAPKHD